MNASSREKRIKAAAKRLNEARVQMQKCQERFTKLVAKEVVEKHPKHRQMAEAEKELRRRLHFVRVTERRRQTSLECRRKGLAMAERKLQEVRDEEQHLANELQTVLTRKKAIEETVSQDHLKCSAAIDRPSVLDDTAKHRLDGTGTVGVQL